MKINKILTVPSCFNLENLLDVNQNLNNLKTAVESQNHHYEHRARFN